MTAKVMIFIFKCLNVNFMKEGLTVKVILTWWEESWYRASLVWGETGLIRGGTLSCCSPPTEHTGGGGGRRRSLCFSVVLATRGTTALMEHKQKVNVYFHACVMSWSLGSVMFLRFGLLVNIKSSHVYLCPTFKANRRWPKCCTGIINNVG